ncbi:MAG TPA: threonine synthase [Erysipelotrichaceae bacterium]|nr:MAG: threonine synthase [Firmicutes bacterium GWE2_51_13]HBZ40459.1 threonine synthase [Erysipelotrichaceae bacterium]
MRYTSTRDERIDVSSAQAILEGLAPDGGLFFPSTLPRFDAKTFTILNYQDLAREILAPWFSDFTLEELDACIREAYTGRFESEEVVTTKKVGDRYIVELFHGPTAAFKDVALSLFPRMLVKAREKMKLDKDLVILAATSGDTGSAALTGLKGLPHIGIITIFPEIGISEIQRLQMTTQNGKNQKVASIEGNFDDAQNAVKRFLSAREEDPKILYSSANSINIGRLLPQIVYYVHAYNTLVARGEISMGEMIDVSVPTGNFGNILAGYLAKSCGLPLRHLLCASNSNHVLTDFFHTGIYDRNRGFETTLSPSMDILISSNLERLLWSMSDGDSPLIRRLMDDLKSDGRFVVPESLRLKLQETFKAGYADDQATLATIRSVYQSRQYLLDPHTAVAWKVAEENPSSVKCLVMATASPFKFPQSIAKAMHWPIEADLDSIQTMSNTTGIPIPASLAALHSLPILHHDLIDPNQLDNYVRSVIKEIL